MAVFSSISDTGYDTVITTLGQQDLRNAVWCNVLGNQCEIKIATLKALETYSMYTRNWHKAQKYAFIKKSTILTQFFWDLDNLTD